MLDSIVIQSLILLIFTFLLKEYLTLSTIIMTVLGVVSKVYNLKPSKWIINFFALLLLISFWVSFNKIFDPEIGLNFLLSVAVLKLIESETKRDSYMIFFGLILLISSGALFEKTLIYSMFFFASFFTLIFRFYLDLNLKLKIKDQVVTFLLIAPFVFLCFIIFPRALSPIDLGSHTPKEGEIGHNPNVEISKFSSLSPTNSSAFIVELNPSEGPRYKYWRGNTVSYNNGWDWTVGSIDQDSLINLKSKENLEISDELIHQKIKLSFSSNYLFSLEMPSYLQFNGDLYFLGRKGLPHIKDKGSSYKYEVWSNNTFEDLKNDSIPRELKRSALTQRERVWVKNFFKETEPKLLVDEVRKFFVDSQFSYTLNPGLIDSFWDFMMDKKSGLCSHYASALGLILREKKIPARLVSGFLGGELNPFGNYFEVKQNDAHVWVEYLDKGIWQRVDPTLWIAPLRGDLSTQEFLDSINVSNSYFSQFRLPFSQELKVLRFWFSQWDFKFYQWIENLDYGTQELIFKSLRLKKSWPMFLIPCLALLISGLFLFSFKKKMRKSDILWREFLERIYPEKNWPKTFLISIMKENLQNDKSEQAQVKLQLLEDIERYSFKHSGNFNHLIKRIKKINDQ